MTSHLRPVNESGRVVAFDLTDEEGLLVNDRVDSDRDGVRVRLGALNLKPSGSASPSNDSDAGVFDLAVFRATGNHQLASLFGKAA